MSLKSNEEGTKEIKVIVRISTASRFLNKIINNMKKLWGSYF